MATITTFPTNLYGRSIDAEESAWESPLLVVADTYEITGLPSRRTHWFLGVVFCDSTGAQVAATGTDLAVAIKPWTTMFYEAPATAAITPAAPVQIDWYAPTYGVRVTPSGTATATHYKVRLAVTRN